MRLGTTIPRHSLHLALFITFASTSSFQFPRTTILRRQKMTIRPHHDPATLRMTLIPIPASDLTQILPTNIPTPEQYTAYWGRTSRERYNAIFEACSVTFLGLFGSYFLSFVIGTPLATLSGAVAAFWVLLGPELKAYQRNWELRGGRDLVDYDEEFGAGLYGAYYFGSVVNVGVVESADSLEEYELEEFWDYTMEKDENERFYGLPWRFRLRLEDSEGRMLQVHARMSEEYLCVERGMPVAGVLLSIREDFGELAALTDFYVPDAGVWVGDYPFLDKRVFKMLLGDRRLKRLLEKERIIYEDDYDDGDFEPELGSEWNRRLRRADDEDFPGEVEMQRRS